MYNIIIMLFLVALEEAVIHDEFLGLLQHSSSSDHDTWTAVAPVLQHCRGPDLL